MEISLFPLKSISATWLDPSFTTWAMDMILAFVCGLGIFLLLLPRLQGNPSFPPPRKKEKLRKQPKVKKVRYKCRKYSGTPKASGSRLKNVMEIQNLLLLLQSLIGKLWDKDSVPQLLHEDAPGEEFKQGLAVAQEPPHQHLEDPSPITLSPLASLTSLTKHTLPLASSLSKEHEDQSDLNRIPLDIVPQSSLPGHSYWASLITAISGLDCISYSISFLSWWWATAKFLFFSTWLHGKSKEEHLFHHPSDPTLWVDPSRWQVESGGLSFINSDVQTLLEMLITKRVELKMWKENAKNGSSFKQINPDYSVYSLGNILKSLGGKRDTNAQTFWNIKGKPEQPRDSQDFSYHKALEGPLEQKYSQLFWGLPSLHSESLVATAWVSKRSSTAQYKVVAFNKVSEPLSVQYQNKEPSQHSQEEAQSQLLAQNLSASVAQDQTSYCLPNLPSSSSSPIKTGITTCTKSKKEAQSFIPTEDKRVKCPSKNRMKWKEVLFSEIQKTQEAYNQLTQNLPQGSLVSQTSTSQKLQKRPQQHIQGKFISDKQHLDPPCRFLASQEQMHPQGKFLEKGKCQKKDKPGPSQATQSALDGRSSTGIQKMESKHSEGLHTMGLVTFKLDSLSKGVEPEQHKQPVDISRSAGSTSVKIQNDNKENSESHLRRTRKGLSKSDSPTGPEKESLEKILQDHLSRKSVQISEGMIPVCVRGSWLAANYVFPKSNMHTKPIPIQLASSKDQQSYVNTFQELSFLDPGTYLMLETDIMRSRVRHRWSPYLQALDPINCNLGEVQTSPLPQPAFSSSASHDSRAISIAKVANLLEELPQKGLGKRVIRKISFPTLQSPFPAPSPSEVQRTWKGVPLGGSHKTSEACMPSQAHTYSFLNQSRVIMGTGKASLEPSPNLDMVRYETRKKSKNVASGDPRHGVTKLEIKLGAQSEKTKETEVEEEKSPEWEVTVGTSMMANSQTINVNLRSLASLGNRKSPSPSKISIFQDPGEPNLQAKVGSGVQLKVEFESEKQPQDQVTGVLQDCHTDELSITDILPSQASLSNSQSMSWINKSISQGLCDVLMKGGNSQGQKEPKATNVEVPGRDENEMLCLNDKREGFGRPRPGQEKQISQDRELSPLAKVKEIDTLSSKSFTCLPEKDQSLSGSYVKKKMKDFLQSFNIYKKGKGKDDSLNKVKLPTGTAQTQRSVTSQLSKENGVVEPQALMNVVGQILMDKLGLQHRSGPTELNGHKEELQTLVSRQFCDHKGSSYSEQRQMIRDIASGHQASSKSQSILKNKWITDKDSNWTRKPRNPEPPVTPIQHRPIGLFRVHSPPWALKAPAGLGGILEAAILTKLAYATPAPTPNDTMRSVARAGTHRIGSGDLAARGVQGPTVATAFRSSS
ncbi:spermatogenesis-associated protein 31E1-like [Sciurus carolinensis]|uniref:spermatogenesis-associated protein 31E1-like n=1 Tax=Sciurus carolinensis TaxID=30640 RepID=UPI001FB525EF|nr:spermatogenesis-associated protein 31E1-like [Sciurus carolinensis]